MSRPRPERDRPRPPGWLIFAVAAACSACTLVACSALVDPWSEALKCNTSSASPCPSGLECVGGTCQQSPRTGDQMDASAQVPSADSGPDSPPTPIGCGEVDLCFNGIDDDCDGETDEGAPETCNGLDDDCDRQTDEGEDEDQDGFTWCGSGDRKAVDCDDFEFFANPDQPESCDGIDNDCDNITDEEVDGQPLCPEGQQCLGNKCMVPGCTQGSCPEGERCDLGSGTCVDAGCTPGSCPEGTVCDSISGQCNDTARENGSVCLLDSDCLSGMCIDSDALRLRALGDRVCGEACCSDQDCGGSELCYASGSGARSCLPAVLDPRPNPFQSCTSDDHCGFMANCAAVQGQTVETEFGASRDDLVAPVCVTGGFGSERLASCSSGGSCGSGVCTGDPNGSFFSPGFCTSMCETSADCADIQVRLSLTEPAYCRFAQVDLGNTLDDYIPVCVASRGEAGDGAPGDACNSNTDCQDNACVLVGEIGRCAPTCCSDSQCAGLPGTRCRPVAFSTRHEMRCVP